MRSLSCSLFTLLPFTTALPDLYVRVFQSPFPAGNEGECDVMLLVERREMIEAFLKEIVSNVDYEYYPALSSFLEAQEHITIVRQKVTRIVKFLRTLLAKKSLHLVSFHEESHQTLKSSLLTLPQYFLLPCCTLLPSNAIPDFVDLRCFSASTARNL